jgi:membrane glycosyltransferase
MTTPPVASIDASAAPIAARDEFALRRSLFFGLAVFITAAGFILMLRSYSGQRIFWFDYIVIALFPLLFGQVAIGFVIALYGFFDKLRGGDPHHVMRRAWRKNESAIPLAATAIVIPVYNEDVARVSQAVVNMWRSVEKTGQLEHFDFYLCSDSNDADHWVEEECAWISLCQKLNGFGKIFYRKRRNPVNGKSGNVADFCRRWGKRYRYMIVLDADSIMIGETLVRLVRAMEANPAVGILQTQPYMVLGQSLLRRALQFSSHVYGGIFSQGCSVAQMSSGSYWGHNAIIRVAPFIEYCDLPLLPVPDPKKRHVLSHDTVEAALMRRAGYEVWIAYDEPGSFEEGPPNLSDMLKRDRRWCAGNLQHFWFLFARDVPMGSRMQIWIGLMAYLCSPLWLAFLVAGAFGTYARMRFLMYSAGPEDLGAATPSHAEFLFTVTLVLLFLPRILSILTTLPRVRLFGGFFAVCSSTLLETLLSILLAPVLMMFHTLFVLQTMLGIQTHWGSQNRSDAGLGIGHCLNLYGWLTVLGIAGQVATTWYLGLGSLWLAPIFLGWTLAPFLAWLTSSVPLGLWLKKHRLFLTAEESQPPPELAGLSGEAADEVAPGLPIPLWTHALLCPYVQAIHLSLVRQRNNAGSTDSLDASEIELRERLVKSGPLALGAKEKLRLLWDAEAVHWLHRELWSRPDAELHPAWLRLHAECASSPLLLNYVVVE